MIINDTYCFWSASCELGIAGHFLGLVLLNPYNSFGKLGSTLGAKIQWSLSPRHLTLAATPQRGNNSSPHFMMKNLKFKKPRNLSGGHATHKLQKRKI